MKTEFWSYLMADGEVYPLGEFDADFDTAWPKVFAKAERVAEVFGTQPEFALNETDLTEMTQSIEDCFNTMQNARGGDHYMVGGALDKRDIPLLRELEKQYPDCGFFSAVLLGCDRAAQQTREAE